MSSLPLLRPLGIGFHMRLLCPPVPGGCLSAAAPIARGATLALLPRQALVSIHRVHDEDTYGLCPPVESVAAALRCPMENFDVAVLALALALRCCLRGESWYSAAVAHYHNERLGVGEEAAVAEDLHRALSVDYAMPPLPVLAAAMAYVRGRSFFCLSVPSPLPSPSPNQAKENEATKRRCVSALIDTMAPCSPGGAEGPCVACGLVSAAEARAALGADAAIRGARQRLRGKAEGWEYVAVTAARDIAAGELITANMDNLLSLPEEEA